MKYRPFNDTLADIRGGAALDQLGRELNKLVGAVIDTGAAGEITLKLKVKPLSKKQERGSPAIAIVDDISVKLPKVDAGGSIFFATPENNLTRHDPQQRRLPLEVHQGGGTAPQAGQQQDDAASGGGVG